MINQFFRRRKRTLKIEFLESRRFLAGVISITHDIMVGREHLSGYGALKSAALDLDGDGDDDILFSKLSNLSNRTSGFLGWYENNGQGEFSEVQEIEEVVDLLRAEGGDVDGDADADIVTVSRCHGCRLPYQVAWYENLDGQFAAATKLLEIDLEPSNTGLGAEETYIGLATTSISGETEILVGTFGMLHVIGFDTAQGEFAVRTQELSSITPVMSIVDFDDDGDDDLITYDAESEILTLHRNSDGTFSAGEEWLTGIAWTHTIVDLDGDSQLDVIEVTSDPPQQRGPIVWHRNQGDGSFSRQSLYDLVLTRFSHGVHHTAKDTDLDGDLDLLIATLDAGSLLHSEQISPGEFGPPTTISPHTENLDGVDVADFDGDGDLDILGSSYSYSNNPRIVWFERTEKPEERYSRRVIDTGPQHPSAIYTADMDGDQRIDLVTRQLDAIVVHRDVEGESSLETRLSSYSFGQNDDVAGDFDGDGTIDFAIADPHEIRLFFNIKGNGILEESGLIAFDADPGFPPILSRVITAADIDRDGNLDLLIGQDTVFSDFDLIWVPNTEGDGSFPQANTNLREIDIQRHADVTSVATNDLDGDGDVDIVATAYDGDLFWLENTDGQGNFGPPHDVNESVDSFTLGDVDGDGLADIVASIPKESRIVWHRNTTRGTGFSEMILATPGIEASNVHIHDVDNDGDGDIVAAANHQIIWLENDNELGDFQAPKTISTAHYGQTNFASADINQDGRTDLISMTAECDEQTRCESSRLAWHESLLIGDSNKDGIFNSSDFVTVFQAGKYEDGIPGNATFEEGDWNQDGDFNSSDLVVAFQSGNFVFTVRPSNANLATAVDRLFERDDSWVKERTIIG